MLLTYKNLKIRNALPDDAGLLCGWWNDGRVMAHAGFPNGLGITAEKIAASLATDDESFRRLIIEADGSAIGEMNYRTMDGIVAEIGIKICNFSKQEQGFGTILLKMLIGALFDRGMQKIAVDTNLNNLRAQHVYKKVGFKKLRVNYDAWKDQIGNLQSFIDYELSKTDFTPLE